MDHHDPTSEAASRAAQAAALAVGIVEAVLLLRAQTQDRRAQADQQTAAARGAQEAAHRASDRSIWWPALGTRWLTDATTPDLLLAWAAAQPWTRADPLAPTASARLEVQLHQRHPDAMFAYQAARAAGQDPADAMRQAAPLFTARPAIEPIRGEAAMARIHTPPTPAAPSAPVTITTLSRPHR